MGNNVYVKLKNGSLEFQQTRGEKEGKIVLYPHCYPRLVMFLKNALSNIEQGKADTPFQTLLEQNSNCSCITGSCEKYMQEVQFHIRARWQSEKDPEFQRKLKNGKAQAIDPSKFDENGWIPTKSGIWLNDKGIEALYRILPRLLNCHFGEKSAENGVKNVIVDFAKPEHEIDITTDLEKVVEADRFSKEAERATFQLLEKLQKNVMWKSLKISHEDAQFILMTYAPLFLSLHLLAN